MTESRGLTNKKKGAAVRTASLLWPILLLLLLLFLARSELLNEWMQNALSLCAEVLVPSLFPFLILSELMVSGGLADRLGRLMARPFRALFGISGGGASCVLLGMLCGFPIGARMAIGLYERGETEREETERLLAFCSIPSPAFLIGTVGVSLLGSRRDGILLYAANVAAAVLVCVGSHLFGRTKSAVLPPRNEPKRKGSGGTDSRPFGMAQITRAVTGSVSSMLHICAFVLAFSCVIRLLDLLLSYLPVAAPPFLRTVLFGFLELTGGMAQAASLPRYLALPAAALISGWSGLSVHAQIISLSGARPLSFRPYLIAKLISSLLCAGLVILATALG